MMLIYDFSFSARQICLLNQVSIITVQVSVSKARAVVVLAEDGNADQVLFGNTFKFAKFYVRRVTYHSFT